MGSSANTTLGSVTRARAMRHPLGLAARQLPRATPFQALEAQGGRARKTARLYASFRLTRLSSRGRATLSAVLSSGTSWPNWNTKPKAVRRSLVRLVFVPVVDPLAVEPDFPAVRLDKYRPGNAAGSTCPSRSGP